MKYGSTDEVSADDVEKNENKVENSEKILDYDDLVGEIGEFGLFQKIACFLLWVPAAAGGIHVMMYSFTGLEPEKYRCNIPGCNSTSYDGYIPANTGKDNQSCTYYEAIANADGACEKSGNTVIECKYGPYIFDDSVFSETTVTRFNVLCANAPEYHNVAFTGTAYMLGLMIGSIIAGYCSDKFGRKIAILGCILVSSIGSLAGSFMPDYWSYLALRFITALGAIGLFNESFTLTVELMGSKEIVRWLPWVNYKNLNGNVIQVPYAIGEALLGLVAYFLRNSSYVTLQWTVSVACFIQIPVWYFLPESPRWLIARGKTEQARALMMKAAKQNGKSIDLSNHVIKSPKVDESAKQPELGFADLFKTKDILIITIIMFFCWPIITMGYYGLGMSMTKLGSNIFVTFILGALVEIPGYLGCMLLIDVWGRKPFFVVCLLLTGVFCIGAGLLNAGALRTALALAGKLCAAGNFSVVYMYTAEIYPTIIRNTAIGSCSMVRGIGGLAAPYIAFYLPEVWEKGPMLIMGGTSLFGGILAFALPETLGSKLPEKMEDVKEMKKNSKPMWTCIRPQFMD